jgi:gliding motility-associated-like protein
MLNRRTRSLLFAILLFLVGNFAFAQSRSGKDMVSKPSPASMKAGAFIDVNASGYPESNYSITQLVKDVLISGGGTCSAANVSNVVVSPNLAATNQNRSWGFFHKANTNFPFAKGIVLTTGYARKAGNDFQANLSDGLGTGGDVDLAAALGISNTQLNDATYIEFDFVPASTKVTFRYLFASKEYQLNYPCNISDGFALLLKPAGGAYTNLAVLPGTAGPVSVTNIHPAISTSTGSCAAVNESYFGGYNPTSIETNFNGRTIPLTATATVVPGQSYHFKMVLADYQDPSFDSAVFLEAGSFDIGVQILNPAGVSLPSSINVCDNQPQTFTASVQGGGATYQWLLGTNPIPGATNASYTATQPGVYTVQVFLPGNTCPGTATVTVVGGTSPTVQNTSLTACYTPGNAVFNLTSAQSAISTTPGATFSYYLNLTDANAGNTSTIPVPTAFSSAGQTVYVLVKSGVCSKVAELQLTKAPQMTATIAPPGQALTCTNSQITLNGASSVYPAGTTFNWTTTGGNIVSGANTLNPVVNTAGTYTLTLSNTYQPGNITCTSTADVVVTGDSAPPTTGLTASKILICAGEAVTLTASGGTTYNWTGLTGNGNTQTVTPATTTTYTVTAVGANGCISQNPATITIEVSQPITVQNASLFKCYVAGGINYDLTEAQTQITSAPGVTFAYYLNIADANAGNTNTINNSTSFNSAGNQTIYVLVVSGGCRYVVNLQLLSTPQTTLTINPVQQITCTTPQITINASTSVIPAGSTITWSTAGGNIVSGANTLTPIVNAGGVYTLTVSNVNQPGNLTCTYTANVTVTQNTTPPVATITSTFMQICSGESVTLTASGGATYNWGNGLPGNGNTQVVSPTSNTTYTVQAVGANGCISTNTASITIIVAPPVAVLTASKIKICAGESVTLTASGGVTYEWVGLPGNGNTQVVTPTITTTYGVFALGGNGCKVLNPTEITIEVVPAIVSTLEDVYVCAGDFGILDAGAGLNYTYVWSTGATTQTISVNTPGTYSVTINNGTCSKVFTAQLLNPDLPQFTNIVYENHVLTLSATNPTDGVLEFSIDGGVSWQNSNIFYNVLDNTNHNMMVRVKDAKCSTSIQFFTFVVSNAITPNADGKNDSVDFTGISSYNNFAASIFDRYSQEVFKASKTETIWNGALRNSLPLPTGTYWYRVQWENPASKKLELRSGWILLKNRN